MNSKLKMKAGFSESGFGCCGHFAYCDMGKGNCFYNETDPAVKTYCAAYQRNHFKGTSSERVVDAIVPDEVEAYKEKVEELIEQEDGQFSLF